MPDAPNHADATSRRRNAIRRGISSNLIAQVVAIVIQLCTLPLFLHFWPIERYGAWLLITAIPAYVALADLGLGASLTNALLISASRDDHARSRALFSNAHGVFLVVALAIGCLAALASVLLANHWPGVAREHPWLIAVLTAYALVSVYQGILSAPFRSVDRYALGVNIGSGTRCVEFATMAAVLWFGGSETALIAAMLMARTGGTLVIVGMVRRLCPTLTLAPNLKLASDFWPMAGSGIGLMSFPLVNAMSNQGFLLAIGWNGDTRSVAIYSSVVSLTRLLGQTNTSVVGAFQPEIVRDAAAHRFDAARGLLRNTAAVSACSSIVMATGLILFGDLFLRVWSSGKISGVTTELVVLSLAFAVRAVWLPCAQLVTGMNQPRALATLQLVVAVLATLGVLVGARLGAPIAAAISLTVVSELVFAWWAIRLAMPMVLDAPLDYLRAAFQWRSTWLAWRSSR